MGGLQQRAGDIRRSRPLIEEGLRQGPVLSFAIYYAKRHRSWFYQDIKSSTNQHHQYHQSNPSPQPLMVTLN